MLRGEYFLPYTVYCVRESVIPVSWPGASPFFDGRFMTGLKLENYYVFTFTFSWPEVGKLFLIYFFTFSFSWPEVGKLFLIYFFTFSRPEVGKLFRIYVFTFSTWSWKIIPYFDGLVQDCSNSSELAMELLQSCTKPSKYGIIFQLQVEKK